MGRKKRKVMKPWCWYCNRDFDDVKILIQHQQAKHFKCHHCNKRLMSGPGLIIHALQVHKDKIDRIPGSLPNRNNPTLEIYGMDGVPEGDAWDHEQMKMAAMGLLPDGQPPSKMPHMMPPMPPPGMMPPTPYGMPGYGAPPSDIPQHWQQPQHHQHHMPPQMPQYPPHSQHMPPMPHGMPPNMPPSAPAAPTTSMPAHVPMPPTAFPAYGASSGAAPPVQETKVVSLMTTATGTIRHPDIDQSLEERRATFQRYSEKHNYLGHATLAAAPTLYTHPHNTGRANMAALGTHY